MARNANIWSFSGELRLGPVDEKTSALGWPPTFPQQKHLASEVRVLSINSILYPFCPPSLGWHRWGKCTIFIQISFRLLLHGITKLVCYE